MSSVVESRITHVTVFQRGAMVTRSCRLDADGSGFPEGVTIPRLPLLLEDDSLRVRIVPDGGGVAPRARGVSVRLSTATPDPALRPADDAELWQARLEESRQRARFEQCLRDVGSLEELGVRKRQRVETALLPSVGASGLLEAVEFRITSASALLDEARSSWLEWDRARKRRLDLEEREARATSAKQLRPEQLARQVTLHVEPAAGQDEAAARSVTLFEDRARVERRGRLALDASNGREPTAPVRLVVRRVSPVIADQTLVVRAGSATVLDARVERRWTFTDEQQPSSLQGVLQALHAAQVDAARLRAEIEERNELGRQLRGIQRHVLEEASEDLSFGKGLRAELASDLDAVRARERAATNRQLEAEQELERLERRQYDLELQRSAFETPETRMHADLVATVLPGSDPHVELEFEYTVPCACWRPNYTLELGRGEVKDRAEAPRVTIERAASVWQNTGEDWTDVELRFSTERRSLRVEPPELRTEQAAAVLLQSAQRPPVTPPCWRALPSWFVSEA